MATHSKTEPKHPDADEGEPRIGKPRRRNSWEAKNAIIYDVSTQTLHKEKKENFNPKEHTHVTIPKRAKSPLTKDRVRLSVSYTSTSIELFLADVKLDKLGFWVAIQRYSGNIGEIWVKGFPSAGCSIVPGRC